MKSLFLLFFLTAQVLLAKPPGIYPDRKLTPGVVAMVTQEEVLRMGYTVDARHVSDRTKWEVLMRYKLATGDYHTINQPQLSALLRQYEIDHFISLELGGANDIRNLWPEPYMVEVKGEKLGARQKDVVETGLHRMMAKGILTLPQVQAIIRKDWVRAYHEMKMGKPITVPRVR